MLNCGAWKNSSFWIHNMEKFCFLLVMNPEDPCFISYYSIHEYCYRFIGNEKFTLRLILVGIQTISDATALRLPTWCFSECEIKKNMVFFIFQKWTYPVRGALDLQRLNKIMSHCMCVNHNWFHALWKRPHSSCYYWPLALWKQGCFLIPS